MTNTLAGFTLLCHEIVSKVDDKASGLVCEMLKINTAIVTLNLSCEQQNKIHAVQNKNKNQKALDSDRFER